MTLCDSGPLYSLIDPRQQNHGRCRAVVESLLPLVTTWPCLTEAMYFLGRSGGWRLQQLLWGYRNDGLLRVHAISPPEETRVQQLMQKYQDTPMSLADASLVALAEAIGLYRVFTLDSDFRIYRTASGAAFEISP